MAKINYDVKYGRQGRPRAFTKIHDLRIKQRSYPIEANIKKRSLRINSTKCNVEATRRKIQRPLKCLGLFYKHDKKLLILMEKNMV